MWWLPFWARATSLILFWVLFQVPSTFFAMALFMEDCLKVARDVLDLPIESVNEVVEYLVKTLLGAGICNPNNLVSYVPAKRGFVSQFTFLSTPHA